jgi:hypothetical protein
MVGVAPQHEGPNGQVDGVNVIIDDLGSKSFSMGAHALHQGRSPQALDVAGPVINLGGGHQLPTLFDAGDEDGRAVRSRGVHGRALYQRVRSR